MDQVPNTITSRLFAAVIEFWSLLLRQESWPLLSKPDTSASHKTVDEGSGGGPQVMDVDLDSCDHLRQNWKLESFLLNEERDRLCLWKFNFTDEDLDRLAGNQSCVFGGAVVQCLVDIGQALTSATDLQSCTYSISGIEASYRALNTMLSEGRLLIRNVYYDDDVAETLASTGYEASAVTELTVPDNVPINLREVVKANIGKLQRLSFSISQTLVAMTG